VDSATIPLDPAPAPKTECFNPELHEEHAAVTKRAAPEDEGTKTHPFSFREVQVQGYCLCSCWAIPRDHSHPSGPAHHGREQTGFRGHTKTLRSQEGKQTRGRGSPGESTAGEAAVTSLPQNTSTSTNSAAALGSPLPAYRMLFPNIAVHKHGTVLISMPWASMFSAAIRPAREKQQNKPGSSAPGQALWSALRSQHSIDISSPRL